MRSRVWVAIVVGAAGLGSAGSVVTPSAYGASPPTAFAGSVTCQVAGSFSFAAPLLNTGTSPSNVTVRSKLTGCTGPGTTSGPATLSGGNLVATSSATSFLNVCGAVLGGQPLPPVTGVIKWRTSGGRAAQSTAFAASETVYYNQSTNTASVYLTVSITSGSYAGSSMVFSGLGANSNGLLLSSACAGRGLGSIKFGSPGGIPTGSVTLGA